MEKAGLLGLVLIAINVLVSFKGFRDMRFFNTYLFEVYEVKVRKDYRRLITSGFLHLDVNHLLFNMLTLFFFSPAIEHSLGELQFLLIYFASLVGGNLVALYFQRHNYNYSAVGASGAISGLVFAAIALFPGIRMSLIFIPIPMPGWLFGLAYVLYSIYGIRSQRDNVGHEAHLGGGLVGLLVAVLLEPSVLVSNYLPIVLMVVPSVVFFYLVLKRKI